MVMMVGQAYWPFISVEEREGVDDSYAAVTCSREKKKESYRISFKLISSH